MKFATTAFILAIICLSQVNAIDSSVEEMRTKLISFISEKTEGVVSEVLDLLEGLVTHAKRDIVEENARWVHAKALLVATLNKYTTLRNEQEIACNKISKKIAELAEDIQEHEDHIARNIATMKRQAAELTALLNSRCQATKTYINNLKNNRETLGVLEVVAKAIDNFHPKLLQVSDLQYVMTRFGNFINLYAKEHEEVFAQLMWDVNGIHARTKEEIGNSYKDNHKGEISVHHLTASSVQKLSSVKAELMKIIDTIRASTKADMKEQEANMITCNSKAADFEGEVQEEARRLTLENEELTKELHALQKEKKHQEVKLAECHKVLEGYKRMVIVSQKNLNDETAKHVATIKRLESEQALFEEVVAIYKAQVIGAASAIKARAEDYAAHGNFKSTSKYTRSEVNGEYHNLHNNVRKTLVKESH